MCFTLKVHAIEPKCADAKCAERKAAALTEEHAIQLDFDIFDPFSVSVCCDSASGPGDEHSCEQHGNCCILDTMELCTKSSSQGLTKCLGSIEVHYLRPRGEAAETTLQDLLDEYFVRVPVLGASKLEPGAEAEAKRLLSQYLAAGHRYRGYAEKLAADTLTEDGSSSFCTAAVRKSSPVAGDAVAAWKKAWAGWKRWASPNVRESRDAEKIAAAIKMECLGAWRINCPEPLKFRENKSTWRIVLDQDPNVVAITGATKHGTLRVPVHVTLKFGEPSVEEPEDDNNGGPDPGPGPGTRPQSHSDSEGDAGGNNGHQDENHSPHGSRGTNRHVSEENIYDATPPRRPAAAVNPYNQSFLNAEEFQVRIAPTLDRRTQVQPFAPRSQQAAVSGPSLQQPSVSSSPRGTKRRRSELGVTKQEEQQQGPRSSQVSPARVKRQRTGSVAVMENIEEAPTEVNSPEESSQEDSSDPASSPAQPPEHGVRFRANYQPDWDHAWVIAEGTLMAFENVEPPQPERPRANTLVLSDRTLRHRIYRLALQLRYRADDGLAGDDRLLRLQIIQVMQIMGARGWYTTILPSREAMAEIFQNLNTQPEIQQFFGWFNGNVEDCLDDVYNFVVASRR